LKEIQGLSYYKNGRIRDTTREITIIIEITMYAFLIYFMTHSSTLPNFQQQYKNTMFFM
jgi:hypothetical protein